MNILVDIGNTRIKWCVHENGILKTGQPLVYKQIDFIKEIQQQWAAIAAPERLAISSVSKKQITQQIIELAKKYWPEVEIFIAESSAHAFSVTNAYQQADKLGVDRWLALIALQHYYPGYSCIVDCGTAITIDCIDQQGQHLGGLISPGLQLMKQSLSQGTETLSLIKQPHTLGLSDSTESAIYTGTLFAAAGLIEKAINSLCICQTLVLTGGDAEVIAKYLTLESIIEADFILKGLSMFCQGEKPS